MEAAERQARSIEGDSKGEKVNTLDGARGNSWKGNKGNCYRCGLEGHFARDPECTARLATCGMCKKLGHFAKVCRTKSDDKTRKGDIRQVSEDDGFAFTIQTRGKEIPTVDIELGGAQLKGVLVDSGSTSNVIDRGTWEMLKRNNIKCDSRKSNRKLYSYGSDEPLTTAGEFVTELCYKDKVYPACFVVVEEKARAIISRQTSEELGILKIEINTVSHDTLLEEYPECFQGVGKLKGFQAKLHIDESVKPIAH